MSSLNQIKKTSALLLLAVACLAALPAVAQEEEAVDPLLKMVLDLIGDADKDMRAMGLQQVREETPGKATTLKYAEVLPTLSPESQAALLEALGARGDLTAKPVVLKSLASENEAIRAAALGALGLLGTGQDVPALVDKAAAGSEVEKRAARQSLVLLRGDDINQALVAVLADSEPAGRAALLGVLAARNAQAALPQVFESVKDSDAAVRSAALEALRFLADVDNAGSLVELVKTAADDAERRKAMLALLSVCGRGREACSDSIIAALDDASPAATIALLDALARSGGAAALEAVVAQVDAADEAVGDQAVRVLSNWTDTAAIGALTEIAKTSENNRRQVLAIRGLVQLAGPRDDEQTPADLAVLTDALGAARRVAEKRLVLGALGAATTPDALALVAPSLDDPTFVEEAAIAVVRIVEGMEDADKQKARATLEKAAKQAKDTKTRARAAAVIETL